MLGKRLLEVEDEAMEAIDVEGVFIEKPFKSVTLSHATLAV